MNDNPNNLSRTSLAALQAQLAQAEAKNKTLQAVLDRVVLGGAGAGVVGDSESGSESDGEVVGKGKGKGGAEQEQKAKGKGKGKGKMDIDTHYFDSYASNGKSPIHLAIPSPLLSLPLFYITEGSILTLTSGYDVDLDPHHPGVGSCRYPRDDAQGYREDHVLRRVYPEQPGDFQGCDRDGRRVWIWDIEQ